MSSTPRFEDRLLDELKREIELREGAERGTATADAGTRGNETRASARRLLTPRRITVAAAGCAVAALATVVAPGSPATPAAYAVERHDDGSVTLTVKDQYMGVGAQRELAWSLRPSHIDVIVLVLAPGHICERGHGTRWGKPVPVRAVAFLRPITLHRGNALVFENHGGAAVPWVTAYTTKREIKPCVPVEPTMPRNH